MTLIFNKQSFKFSITLSLSFFIVSTNGYTQENQAKPLSTISVPTISDTIIVKATRTDTNINDIPAAIDYVDIDDIQSGKQRLSIDESLVATPGLFFQNRNNYAQSLKISVRGFGARANFGTRGIKLYQDGIPLTTVDGQGGIEDIDLNTIKRIEVMRSPSSSLYGSSAGGLIHFYTGNTDLNSPYFEANLSHGDYHTTISNLKTGGYVDKLNYFFSASHLEVDGYRDHSETKNTKLNGKLIYEIDTYSDFTTVMSFYDAPKANDPGGITLEDVKQDRKQARQQNITQGAGEDIQQNKLGFTYNNTLSDKLQLELRNYYVTRDFIGLLPIVNSGFIEFDRFQYGLALQLTSRNSFFSFPSNTILGIEVDRQQDDRQRFQNNSGQKGVLQVDQEEQGEALGMYIQNNTNLSQNLKLTLGLRYDEIELSLKDKFLNDGDNSETLRFSEMSPTLALMWAIAPSIKPYANIAKVFETPTFTELANVPAGGGFTNVTPQTAINYELGFKGRFTNTIKYDLAFFQIDVEDEIINIETIGSTGIFNNADTSRHGLESSLYFSFYDNVHINLSYTYNDFTFSRFPQSICSICSGNNLPGLPKHNFYSELSYKNLSGFYASIDLQYLSEIYTNNENSAKSQSYNVANLRAGYETKLGKLNINSYFGINNLFDKEYISNVRINTFGSRYYEPAPKINTYIGLTLNYSL